VQLLLERRPRPKQIPDYVRKRTPLMEACSEGHCGVVAELLRAGADAEARDAQGLGALQLAANARCKVLVEDCLERACREAGR
jgi:ankyrin repeat protein